MSFSEVASLLQLEASRRLPADYKDDFGRSTFNRFYYAAFLQVRDALKSVRSEWGRLNHSDIPDLLRGSVTRELKLLMGKAKRNSDHRLTSTCSVALTGARELAQMLEQAYAARVVADYNPEIKVDFASPHFKLNETPISEAKNWPSKARIYASSISTALSQAND